MFKQNKTMNDNYYVAFFRSNTLLDRTIRFFAGFGSEVPEYSHVVFYNAKTDTEISLEIPKIKKVEHRERDYAEYLPLPDDLGQSAWMRATDAYVKRERYGTWQVIFKSLTMLFGLRFIKARRDCAEFTLDILFPETKGTNDFHTVGQTKEIIKEELGIEEHEIVKLWK